MTSRRRKSIKSLYTDRQTRQTRNNIYNSVFWHHRTPTNLSMVMKSPTLYNDQYKDYCRKKSLNILAEKPGKLFTRKRTNLKHKMDECMNDTALHDIFNVIYELSIFNKQNNRDNGDNYKKDHSKMNHKIRRTIRVNGIPKIINYLVNHKGIIHDAKTMDYDKLKSHIKYILLNEILISDTFKIKIKFNPRRYIKEIPSRNQMLENSKNQQDAS
jgi:hypothetical protein